MSMIIESGTEIDYLVKEYHRYVNYFLRFKNKGRLSVASLYGNLAIETLGKIIDLNDKICFALITVDENIIREILDVLSIATGAQK